MSDRVELARLFLKLGTIGFGGPAAHIGMMEEEVVTRRGWLTREHFLDLVGATNLIPGPNSTEMAIHIGYLRAGWAGLTVAGTCFILPAVLITAAFAWLYVSYGSLPQVAPLLLGVKPVVLAIILGAVWKLGRTAAKNWVLLAAGLAVAIASLAGVNEVLALFAGAIAGAIALRRLAGRREGSGSPGAGRVAAVWLAGLGDRPGRAAAAGAVGLAAAGGVSLWKLGLVFLGIGSILYGSGYVLVAFLQGWIVDDYGWLTQQQLLDAIAIGQFTPGPVLSTATFIGYLLAGPAGAAVATVAIFLPSFLFVVVLARLLPYFRRSPWMAAFLDAVNAASVGLMATVLVKLGQTTLTAWPAWVIAFVAAVLSIHWQVSAPWLVVGGALAGWVWGLLLGQ